MRRGLLGAMLVVALAGCSQVSALAPVGGDRMAEVRFATIDVVLDSGIAVREAPVCATSGDTIACLGTTAAGEIIAATSTTGDQPPLTVLLDGTSIFSGDLATVLAEAVRP
jgi:uncharacterized membrane protein YgdD (TMEM256/DUF423 family)